MNEYSYQLYASTHLAWTNRHAGAMRLSAPWVALDIDIDDESMAIADRLINAQTGVAGEDVDAFLEGLKDFPVLHVMPRPLAAFADKTYSCSHNPALTATGPLEFAKLFADGAGIEFADLAATLPTAWTWDADAVLRRALIPGADAAYDPYSVYTSIRELRLQHQMKKQPEGKGLIDYLVNLRDSDEATFFKCVTTVLAQQYFVTKECCACLEPALDHHAIIRSQIKDYIAEEINHDKLILRSIKAISPLRPDELTFMPGVRLEIEMIKRSAKYCAVSFACLVSIMEGTVYPDEDPLAALLLASSNPAASEGVEAHFQINKRANHTAIPETFVAALPAVDRQTVLTALRFTETTIEIDAAVMGNLHKYFLNLH